MTRKFISYDPTSGLLLTSSQEDGKSIIAYEQDVEASLDYAAAIRNERTKEDKDLKHVAFVPDSVILKMKFEDGVNFYAKEDEKRVLQLLQTKYTKCKTTYKKIA